MPLCFTWNNAQGSNALDWCIAHNLHYVKCTLLVHSVEDAFALGHVDPRLQCHPVGGGVGHCPMAPRGVGAGQVGEGWGEGEIGRLRKFVYRSARNFLKFSKRVVILITIVPPLLLNFRYWHALLDCNPCGLLACNAGEK